MAEMITQMMKTLKWPGGRAAAAVLFAAAAVGAASCRQPSDLSFLQKDIYYVGSADSAELVLRLDSVAGGDVYGEYYEIADDAEISPEPFECRTMNKRRSVIRAGNRKHTVKSVDLRFDADTFYGSGRVNGRDVFFEFYPYSEPTYHTWPKRYQEKLFSYRLLPDIQYGTASGYYTSLPVEPGELKKTVAQELLKRKVERRQPLAMDIYLPAGDTLSRRPLVMFLHGGGFLFGDKTDGAIVQWCRHFASMGYVAASVNYRMGFKMNRQSVERCGYEAVQDAHAAMRFLVHNRDKYRIDTSCLFVGGSSAGGITGLNLAFMRDKNRPASSYAKGRRYRDLGNVAASGNSLKDRFRVKAVANMWGAVQDLNMLSNASAGIISFHGDADNIV